MQLLGVIIEPGKTSLSPVFQQAALDALQLDYLYQLWATPVDGLATRVTGLRAPTVRGANVTIPHKEAVVPLLDQVDEVARRVGAVNTICNEGGRLLGYNTDVEGFTRALARDAGFDTAGARTLVVGAGGSARAVALSLLVSGAASIRIAARTRSRAESLVADLREVEASLEVIDGSPSSIGKSLEDARLLVNCTPLGTAGTPEANVSPVPAESIHSGMLVVDLVYNPAVTPLLRDAAARGASTLGGLPMLIHQGAASFKLWTGRDAPLDVMFGAARRALPAEGLA